MAYNYIFSIRKYKDIKRVLQNHYEILLQVKQLEVYEHENICFRTGIPYVEPQNLKDGTLINQEEQYKKRKEEKEKSLSKMGIKIKENE